MRLVPILLVSILLLGGGAQFAYAAETDLSPQIESATSPEQHRALAEEYRAKAADARQKAERHRGMARMYARGKSIVSQAPHCNSIAKRHEDNASDYDAMATAHEAAANAAKQ